eukprot:CAMPEP_0194130636 /NCGR_PEP_ID=MMETSP0152-20130528/1632_1 /TAXON_ID=1049557 /ORGANISM="Thalassiothrix antarctica, Strain L6-D1" /LENGTH=367 /DNA_ID=CAMNT_0038825209 /DNA_START=102 /DNA_END=1205 /DNA_ORIENTATION=-
MKLSLDFRRLILLLSLCGKQSMGADLSRFQDILEEIDETLNELEEDVNCPDDFHLNPKSTNRTTFLKQFKPCGYYQEKCKHKFVAWFGDKWKEYPPMEANVDYPGTGQKDLDHHHGVHIVQFDTGLDEVTYEAYKKGDMSLINDINRGTWLDPFANGFTTDKLPLGETCVETFAEFPDDWGPVPGQDNNYDCMGGCGGGCIGVGAGNDCMKHDVCSYFKSYALEIKAKGQCLDIDCGDEAAQANINCYKKQAGKDEAVTCSEDNEGNPNFYSSISPLVRAGSQKRECTLRTKWERNQGMPWARGPDGSSCTSPDDCVSRRCDNPSYFNFNAICQARLANGKECNEHGDCKSQNCVGWMGLNRKCKPK